MSQIETFTIALEKLMNDEIYHVHWSPNMDLIAVTTKSKILEVILIN